MSPNTPTLTGETLPPTPQAAADPASRPAGPDTARDPDWIAAQLRKALSGDPRHLEVAIRHLAHDVELWSPQADREVAEISARAGLIAAEEWRRRLELDLDRAEHWMPCLDGMICELYDADNAAAGERCATELDLHEVDPPLCAGTREWCGTVGRWLIRIWAVTDHDIFEATL